MALSESGHLDNIYLKTVVFYSRSTVTEVQLAAQNSGRTPSFFHLIGGKRPCLEYMEKLSDDVWLTFLVPYKTPWPKTTLTEERVYFGLRLQRSKSPVVAEERQYYDGAGAGSSHLNSKHRMEKAAGRRRDFWLKPAPQGLSEGCTT